MNAESPIQRMPLYPHPAHHQCAAPGCDMRIPGYKLLCYDHWQQLSPETRHTVNLAWTRYRVDPVTRGPEYRDTVRAAVAELATEESGE